MALAAGVGGPALGGLAMGACALGRAWAGLVQRLLLDTPIGERERRAASPDLTDRSVA